MTEAAKTPKTMISDDKKWFKNGPKPRYLCLPMNAVQDRRLKLESLKVLMALALHADNDGKCRPGRACLAELTGLHPVNVSKATSKLVQLGWLTKHQRKGKSSIYFVKTPDDLNKEPEPLELDTFFDGNGFDADE